MKSYLNYFLPPPDQPCATNKDYKIIFTLKVQYSFSTMK